jgi:hypothetical protein
MKDFFNSPGEEHKEILSKPDFNFNRFTIYCHFIWAEISKRTIKHKI